MGIPSGILSDETLAAHVIQRMTLRGYRLQVMKLPRGVLQALAMKMIDRSMNRREVFDWLRGSVRKEVSSSAFYRFTHDFERTAEMVHTVILQTVAGPQMFTLAEAAAHLSVSPDCVRRLVKDGELPARRIGRAIRIPADALHALSRADSPSARAGNRAERRG